MGRGVIFSIISDVHYTTKKDSGYKGIKGFEATKKFSETINELKESKSEFLVNLGDFVGGSKNDLKKALMEIKGTGKPTYSIIGNHELEIAKLNELKKLLGLRSSYYYVDKGRYRLVFLNCFDKKVSKPDERRPSKIIGGPMSDKQINWLKKVLNTNKKVIIFSHKLLAPQDLKKNPIWNKAPRRYTEIENNGEVRKILEKKNNVIAVFQGHLHQESKKKINGISYFVLQGHSQNEDYDEKGKPSKRYYEVRIKNDELKVSKFPKKP